MSSRYTGFTMVLLAVFIVLSIVGIGVLMPSEVWKSKSPVDNPYCEEYVCGKAFRELDDNKYLQWKLLQISTQVTDIQLSNLILRLRLEKIEKFLINTRELKPESLSVE